MRFFLLLLLIASLGCVQKKLASCMDRDWYELGRQDGSSGAYNDAFSQRTAKCSLNEIIQVKAAYESGYRHGLSLYCTLENGFELGRNGVEYLPVCPPALASGFEGGYLRGQRFSKLQTEKQGLDLELSQVLRNLGQPQISPQDVNRLQGQRELLQKQLAEKSADIEKLKK